MFEGGFYCCRQGLERACFCYGGGLARLKKKGFVKLPKYPTTYDIYKSGMGKTVWMNHSPDKSAISLLS